MKRLSTFLAKLLFWSIVSSFAIVLLFKWLPVPITPLMLLQNIEQIKNGKDTSWKHDWVPLHEISKKLQLAVICSEDQQFLNHKGFDFKAIEAAYEYNKKGKKIKGASTISQQTAKNVFLWPQRSWLRKGLETYFTYLIELLWSKERILEVYLNSIEMGNSVFGAEAAAQYWFKTSASKLSTYEAAAIAAILPNPRRYKATPATSYIQSRKQWIIKQMHFFGPLEFKINND